MKIQPPAYDKVRCPNCEGLGAISFKNGFKYWLPDTRWRCESCGYIGSTVDFQNASRARLAMPLEPMPLECGAGI